MHLTVVAYGKLRVPGLRQTADHYLRGLRPWVNLEEVELKAAPAGDKSEPARVRVHRAEKETLTSLVARRKAALYVLDETGRSLATREWAALVREWEGRNASVLLCVGSGLGFSEEILLGAKGVLSLGPQTLGHELARVVLYEQLYRAWSVLRGHPYHNEG